MPTSTFPALLADEVRRGSGRPLVTWYDDRSGERVELSVATYANWVAKTAALLQDELGLERHGTVRLDLPPHWLGPVWLGAAWSVGAAVSTGEEEPADVVVCGPDTVAAYASGPAPVVALSLLPMASRFADPLPAGVLDYGTAVWGQPDEFWAAEAPAPEDVAWRGDEPWTQADLLTAARASELSGLGTRLLTDRDPCSTQGLVALVGPMLGGGGTVWVVPECTDEGAWAHRAETEHATHSLH